MQRADDQNGVAADPDTECERLKADLRQEHEMHLRALADFEIYRRRVERDRAKIAANGKREKLLSLLEKKAGSVRFERSFASHLVRNI